MLLKYIRGYECSKGGTILCQLLLYFVNKTKYYSYSLHSMITARMTSRIPVLHIEGEVAEVALSVVAVVLEADPEESMAEAVAQVKVFKEEADPVIGEIFAMLREMAVEGILMVEITIATAKVDI